jgi:sphingosine kinase
MGTAESDQATHSIPLRNILWTSVELPKDGVCGVFEIDFVTEERRWPSGSYLKPAKFQHMFDSSRLPDHIQSFALNLQRRAYGKAEPGKRAFVLINPHAGKGNAVKLFENEVRPIFNMARISCHVIYTERVQHGVELVRDMDIDAYDMIVACSGDGLPHECFNGLAQRQDARLALEKMPVVMIPCGSGNGMALNLYGTYKASYAALGIVKGITTPLDLVSITQGDKRSLSFLSQAFGLMAELDLGTENMRKLLGNQRFVVGFIQRVFQKKVYPCDIHVKVEIDTKDSVKELYRERTLLDPEGDPKGLQRHGQDDVENMDRKKLPDLKYGTVLDPIPDGWKSISGARLGNFYCGNVSGPPSPRSLPHTAQLLTSYRWRTWLLISTSSPPPCPMTGLWT